MKSFKIWMAFVIEMKKTDSKIQMKVWGTSNVKTVLKKYKFGKFILLGFKTYLCNEVIKNMWLQVTTVFKIVCYWHNDRHTDQQNRIKSLEINPCPHGQMILTRMQWPLNGERTMLSTHGVGKAASPHAKAGCWPLLTPNTKINSKWIKSLNLKHRMKPSWCWIW